MQAAPASLNYHSPKRDSVSQLWQYPTERTSSPSVTTGDSSRFEVLSPIAESDPERTGINFSEKFCAKKQDGEREDPTCMPSIDIVEVE